MTDADVRRIVCGHVLTHGAAHTLEAVRLGLLTAYDHEAAALAAAGYTEANYTDEQHARPVLADALLEVMRRLDCFEAADGGPAPPGGST